MVITLVFIQVSRIELGRLPDIGIGLCPKPLKVPGKLKMLEKLGRKPVRMTERPTHYRMRLCLRRCFTGTSRKIYIYTFQSENGPGQVLKGRYLLIEQVSQRIVPL